MHLPQSRLARLFVVSLGSLTITAFAGCERKEKIVDIKTPAGQIEVERSVDTGKVDVEVERDE